MISTHTSAGQNGPAIADEVSIALAVDSQLPNSGRSLRGKRVGMVVFSCYPADPRPRRAAETLTKEGVSLDLICEHDDVAPKRERRDGIEIFRIPVTHRRGGKLSYAYQYSAFILIAAAILARRSLRRRYDLVYIHNMPDVLVFSALIPKILGAKVILDQHDPMPELMMTIFNLDENSRAIRVMRRLEKWSLTFANLVITVNVACKRIFAARSCPAEKIGIVMNTPDANVFPFRAARSYPVPQPGAGNPFAIMYHGSLVKRNGLELAVAALERVRTMIPGAELRVYGPKSEYLGEVLEFATRRGLQDAIRYLGPKRLEELVTEIEHCDVGVIPNYRNEFTEINTPTRIFEYLALGKPVVAPRTPGIQDYFGPDSLFFFDAGNSEQLAEQIAYVAAHPKEAIDTVERGQQIYLAHAWPRERQTLVDLVSGLLTLG